MGLQPRGWAIIITRGEVVGAGHEIDQNALDVPCHGMRDMPNKGGLYPGGDHVQYNIIARTHSGTSHQKMDLK